MSGQDDFEPRQIFITNLSLWESLKSWAVLNNFHLDLIPTVDADGNLILTYPEGETPTYSFNPRFPGDR